MEFNQVISFNPCSDLALISIQIRQLLLILKAIHHLSFLQFIHQASISFLQVNFCLSQKLIHINQVQKKLLKFTVISLNFLELKTSLLMIVCFPINNRMPLKEVRQAIYYLQSQSLLLLRLQFSKFQTAVQKIKVTQLERQRAQKFFKPFRRSFQKGYFLVITF